MEYKMHIKGKDILIRFLSIIFMFFLGTVGYGQSPGTKTTPENTGIDSVSSYQTLGIKNNLPIFHKNLTERLNFPFSWLSKNFTDFTQWKKAACDKVMEHLFYAPPFVPFVPEVIGEEDRGSYIAQRLVINISADSRILCYLLLPKGKGPFPAVLLLHDHGARFDIGKEKVIRPFDEPEERLRSSQEWVNDSYGGRYIGDELAKKGYICFATDMLNWSDRGGAAYDGQQALASNLLRLGSSFAGTIAYEDLRAAEFLSKHSKVDASKIAAMGHSVGAFRTWQVAALSEHIKAGIAICWMTTLKGIMVPGNNGTRGQSAFTMTHPGLSNYLDFPDLASIACPKPMLFFNGLQDKLFPVPSVEEAYEKMHRVWASQKVDSRLVTKLWDINHQFSKEMQEEAFKWLEKNL